MAKRTGVPSLQKVAAKLCSLILKYYDVIRVLSGDDPAVLAALAAAQSACSTLHQQLGPLREYGD